MEELCFSDFKNLRWQSDWNGYEVGFSKVSAVGFYTSEELEMDLYFDCETGIVLKAILWEEEVEDI